MRTVIIHKWEQQKQEDGRMKSARVETGQTGLFHAWGMDYEEYESSTGNYSVAIVEMANGHVELIPANLIRFAEPAQG